MTLNHLHFLARSSQRVAPLLADAGEPRLARQVTAIAATVSACVAAALAWRAAHQALDAWADLAEA